MKKTILLSCILGLILVACSKNTTNGTFVAADMNQVHQVMTNHTPDAYTMIRPIMYTSNYALPTRDWVEGVFAPALSDYLFKQNSRTPSEGSNVCFEFTGHGISQAYALYHNSSQKLKNASLAVGEFLYFPGLEGQHSMMIFIIQENGKPKLIFFEPQTQRIADDPNQYASFWRL